MFVKPARISDRLQRIKGQRTKGQLVFVTIYKNHRVDQLSNNSEVNTTALSPK
jgi:hypothetical protein